MNTVTAVDYTAHPGEATEDYAVRVATLLTPTVLAEVKKAYDDLTNAVPLMILLTVAEKVSDLAEASNIKLGVYEVEVYDLIYRTSNGSVVVNNDQMSYQGGHVSVGFYSGTDWRDLGEATGEVREFSDLDAAARAVSTLIAGLS
ncbi:hypothetical protein [Kribbella deserti]|uniref:Uncharacterized protein n=1 Tax=Kribbella deserti TaxID=1926257 RepID=A0ABV6QQW1_9ACTN